LTVNAPEINFNEYQNTQQKITTFSFNLSKIPKTTISKIQQPFIIMYIDKHQSGNGYWDSFLCE
jgi:hypothetical protein